jgi:hypothetical protein
MPAKHGHQPNFVPQLPQNAAPAESLEPQFRQNLGVGGTAAIVAFPVVPTDDSALSGAAEAEGGAPEAGGGTPAAYFEVAGTGNTSTENALPNSSPSLYVSKAAAGGYCRRACRCLQQKQCGKECRKRQEYFLFHTAVAPFPGLIAMASISPTIKSNTPAM